MKIQFEARIVKLEGDNPSFHGLVSVWGESPNSRSGRILQFTMDPSCDLKIGDTIVVTVEKKLI